MRLSLFTSYVLRVSVLLGLAFSLSQYTYAQQKAIPSCSGANKSLWTDCIGQVVTPKGQKYIGEFKEGKRTGSGAYIYPHGLKYEGNFVDGHYNGRGVLTQPDGRKYSGEFKNDKFHGQGTEYRADGSIQRSGVWESNALIREESTGTLTPPSLGAQSNNVRRLALVIGNDSYKHVAGLTNARADATAIARALQKAGFKVTLKIDADLSGFKEAIRTFKAEVAGGDEAVFFYAGHGVELRGSNYLLPVDVKGNEEDQVKDDAVPLQRVLEDLQDRKARFTLAIVDACRNNPFRDAGRAIGGRGLAPTSAATGQMVLYSAGTGQQALDRLGERDPVRNGVFTRVLLKEMERPGIPVNEVLRNVREQVASLAKTVGKEQVPAIYDQSLGTYYFTPPNGVNQSPVLAQIPARTELSAIQLEEKFWEDTKSAGNREAFEGYLEIYPKGRYSSLARANISRLSSAQGISVPPVVTSLAQDPAKSAGAVFKDCDECPEMVVIPAGTFLMGSKADTFSASQPSSAEKPQRSVTIRAFAIGKFEVTQEQWFALMGTLPSHYKGRTLPVEQVSWSDAQAFVQKLSAKTGKTYRLPSEAEWEYAARAASQTNYSFGDNAEPLGRYAWFSSNSSGTTHPVGEKLPNAFGLHDMHGNVWEWTEDCWNGNYSGAPTDGSAWTAGDCSFRGVRGGAWIFAPVNLRTAD